MSSRELRQRRAALVAEMNSLIPNEGKAWTAEAREKWDRINSDQEALRIQIEAIERTEQLSKEMREFKTPDQPNPGAYENRVHRSKVEELRASAEYRDSFFQYARTGRVDTTLEMRVVTPLDEGAGSGTNAGYLIPTGFQKELETKLKAFGGMRRNARIVQTASGNTLPWPTLDDTSNSGGFLSINSSVNGANPTFGQVNLYAYLASSKQILIPVQLLQDSAFDLQAELVDAFAIRIGRITNLKYTVGSGLGSSEPAGLVPAITSLVTAVGDSNTSGNTDLNSVGVDDLANLIAKLDPAYRPNAKFMANQSTFDFLRKLKDKYGRPMWEASITQGQPDKIYGYAYDWNQDMDSIAAGKMTIIFGDFSKFIIRDVLGFAFIRYSEKYMDLHQIGFQAYLRTDSACIQPAAFAALYHPLS